MVTAFFGAGIGAFLATVFADVIADFIADKLEKHGKQHIYLRRHQDLEITTMENDLRMKIKAKLAKVNTAVAGMIDPEVDAEEKNGWIAIYNGAMRKIMDEYLADEPEETPAEETAEEPVVEEDVGGITNAPEE